MHYKYATYILTFDMATVASILSVVCLCTPEEFSTTFCRTCDPEIKAEERHLTTFALLSELQSLRPRPGPRGRPVISLVLAS